MNEKTNNTISIRLRAYERLTLLIERMTPNRLIEGLDIAALSVPEVVQILLQKLRTEFDYNLSQQIYCSDELWEQIEYARDQMAAFCLTIQTRLPEGANAMTYIQMLAETYRTNGETPQDKALDTLKREVRQLL